MESDFPHPRSNPFGCFHLDLEGVSTPGFGWFTLVGGLIDDLVGTAEYFFQDEDVDGYEQVRAFVGELRRCKDSSGPDTEKLETIRTLVEPHAESLGIGWCGHVRELLAGDPGIDFRENYRFDESYENESDSGDGQDTSGEPPITSEEEEGFLDWLSEYVPG